MHNDISSKIKRMIKQDKHRKYFKRIVAVLSCFVVFYTVYALMLPALTAKGDAFCGLDEHVHNEECYVIGEEGQELRCTIEEHIHSEECYIDPQKKQLNNDVLEDKTDNSNDEIPENLGNNNLELNVEEELVEEDKSKQEDTSKTSDNENLDNSKSETNKSIVVLNSNSEHISMKSMIDSIILEYRSNDTDTWKELSNGSTINDGDQIRCLINYTVPGNTLSPEQDTIYYKLPADLKHKIIDSDIVYNSDGVRVGTYTIDQNGIIKIKFDTNYVKRNHESGHQIIGYIRFFASADLSHIGDDGYLDLPFSDSLNIRIKVEEKVEVFGDIHVQKQGEKTADGRIKYTIIITSTEGTWDDVVIEDNMTGSLYEKDILIKDKNNNTITPNKIPISGTDKFTLTLPKMNAGDEYTITYFAFRDKNSNVLTASNNVKGSSVNSENIPIQSEAQVNTDFEMIRKSGVYDEKTNTITWTVKLNQDKLDLSGYTIRDYITTGTNTVEYISSVELKSSSGIINVTLPYTFPDGSNDEYAITYKTQVDKYQIGENYVYNKLILYNEDTELTQGLSGVYVGSYKPLTKRVGNVKSENGKYIIPWNVTFDFSSKGIEDLSETTIKVIDKLEKIDGEHYYTRAQLESLKNNISLSFGKEGINISEADWKVYTYSGVESDWEYSDPNGKYTGFSFTISPSEGTITKGKIVNLSYESTGEALNPTINATFINKISINNELAESRILIESENLSISKVDPKYPSEKESEHRFEDLENGLIEWNISLFVPESQRNQSIIVTENLPENVEIESVSVRPGEDFPRQCNFNGTNENQLVWWDGDIKGVATVTKENSKKITITLSNGLNNITGNEPYIFNIKVKLKENITWLEEGMIDKAIFKNEVSAKGNGQSVSDSQTQVVVKSKLLGVISKTGTQLQNSNIVPYEISVNPQGINLLEKARTVLLVDKLEYTGDERLFQANLVPGSVVVYERMPDGSKGNVLKTPFTYETISDATINKHSHILNITIPDDIPLVVTYKYMFTGETSSESNVMNSASLKGIDQTHGSTEEDIIIKIQESSAVAIIQGISFYKVDSNDNGVFLPGAEFKLYKWDTKSGEYIPVKTKSGNEILVTDSSGSFGITVDNLSELLYNTAYKLEEIKPPAGYFKNDFLYYFYISNADRENNPLNLPPEFSGLELEDGDIIYYGNDNNKISLEINKIWKDQSGNEITTDLPEKISINLYQQILGEEKHLYKTYDICADSGWNLIINDLPEYEINENGIKGRKYIYTINEIDVPGFDVKYENTEGVSSGEITITNIKVTGYELPETGGIGTIPFVVIGIILILSSVLIYIKKSK